MPASRKAILCALAFLLAFSTLALAVDWVFVGGQQRASGSEASGRGENNDPEGPITWHYDGQDTLTLDNYDGSEIASQGGDFNLHLVGQNTVVKEGGGGHGYFYSDGSVSHSGEGTFTITGDEGATLKAESPNGGISNVGGDLVISGANVETHSTGDLALGAYNGDLIIENGSVVNAVAETNNGSAGICVVSVEDGGRLVIKDSDVTASSKCVQDARGDAYGIYVANIFEGTPSITIDNSYVSSSGERAAMIVFRFMHKTEYDEDPGKAGTITITGGSVIETPDNGRIIDLIIEPSTDPTDLSTVGQVLGTGSGPAISWDDEAIAKVGLIVPASPEPEPQPEPTPVPESETDAEPVPASVPASAPATSTALPKTADVTLAAELSVFAAASMSAIALGLRRRRSE